MNLVKVQWTNRALLPGPATFLTESLGVLLPSVRNLLAAGRFLLDFSRNHLDLA